MLAPIGPPVRLFGYARDEGFYFHAAGEYKKWFDILFKDPSQALEQDTVDRFWRTNHEHPGFVKSLFALSVKYLHQALYATPSRPNRASAPGRGFASLFVRPPSRFRWRCCSDPCS